MFEFPQTDEPIPADGPNVIPAATVVIFRQSRTGGAPELLMLQRAKEMRFAGNATVFPGGRVDPADRDLAKALLPEVPIERAAAKIAGIRETLEETGLMIAVRTPVSPKEAAAARVMLLKDGRLAPVLDHFGWELATDSLTLYAHWCPIWERAFDTRFFIHDLGTGSVDVEVDATENTRLFWTSAADTLAMAGRGEIKIIFPTRRNLERLAQFNSYDEVLEDIARHPVRRINGITIDHDGEKWLMLPEDAGYPVLGEPLSSVRRS
ncbi:NUDIX domain-containing protein [Novosphingobium sp. PP1Y]|uniref:NUDIX hydrolase n=1 Tax=Novosphingobium sp. PP1Y TaxID=702113 RepID=UPI00020EEAFA|nr:NUDIX domain-containing protein [Novosphingobium sp. PP1Y]CCA92026.1 NUDIX hydrolase [Novosphingobium sp. PP1Y]